MKQDRKKYIWVDLLCWSSAWKIWRMTRALSVEKIYYANVTHAFVPFLGYLKRVLRAPVEQADQIIDGELKFKGMSLYEFIQERLTGLLERWVNQKDIADHIQEFCRANDCNSNKFQAHLKEAAYAYLYRPLQLAVWSEYFGDKDKSVLLLRRSPLIKLLVGDLGQERVHSYSSYILHPSQIKGRDNYYYDRELNRFYFASRCFLIARCLVQWAGAITGSWVTCFFKKPDDRKTYKIGIELTQHRLRMDEINDIAWLENSGEDMDNVCAIQFRDFDHESLQNFHEQKIRRYVIATKPWKILQRVLGLVKGDGACVVGCHPLLGIKLLPLILKSVIFLCAGNLSGWMRFEEAKFISRTVFWQSVYHRLGIRILWTMVDVDEDKLAKAQAIERLGGFSAGGHWSNNVMYKIDNQKCVDILFAWGKHFLKNNFNHYPFKAIFLTGYICDYYFGAHAARARSLREQYPGKFILAYYDNIMANDIPYSRGMQIEIHRMLISLLNKFDSLVVFLKPKRKHVLDEMKRALPELEKFIKEGRVEVFLGANQRLKAVPAQIGMASDLVVGLGISTAAVEAFWAGTTAFHADLTGFERNEFANRGRGIIVFRDIFTLEQAIMQRITGENQRAREEYREYHTCLDPFQDGWASRRIGFVMRRVRKYLSEGLDRQELLQKLNIDYDIYLSTLLNVQKTSWN